MKTVEVVVNPDGSVKIRFDGFAGRSCFVEANKIYKRLAELGVSVTIEQVVPTTDVAGATVQAARMANHDG